MRTLSGMKVIAAAALLGASTLGWAIPMSTVGGVDLLLDQAALGNSGEATEEAWVESILGADVIFDDKMDGGFSWELVDGTTATYAQAFSDAPDYYLVKVGNLKDSNDTHFLFQNLAELAYGVINLEIMGFNIKEGVGKISHVSLFDETVSVPEPGTLALLGLGLLGLGFARRKAA